MRRDPLPAQVFLVLSPREGIGSSVTGNVGYHTGCRRLLVDYGLPGWGADASPLRGRTAAHSAGGAAGYGAVPGELQGFPQRTRPLWREEKFLGSQVCFRTYLMHNIKQFSLTPYVLVIVPSALCVLNNLNLRNLLVWYWTLRQRFKSLAQGHPASKE